MSTFNSYICLTCGYGGDVTKELRKEEVIPCPECNGFFVDKFYSQKYKEMLKDREVVQDSPDKYVKRLLINYYVRSVGYDVNKDEYSVFLSKKDSK